MNKTEPSPIFSERVKIGGLENGFLHGRKQRESFYKENSKKIKWFPFQNLPPPLTLGKYRERNRDEKNLTTLGA